MAVSRAENTVVGVGDMGLRKADSGRLITYALGSCVAIGLFDPQSRVAGLLHAMLPSVRYATERTRDRHWMFVDTGVPQMFRDAYEEGAEKKRLRVVVAGGASVRLSSNNDMFQVGAKNVAMVKALLQKNAVTVAAWHTGGNHARTLAFDLASGEATIEMAGERIVL